ncbi:MAG: AIR synthase-related protein, partial [Gemmatimonadaceae bacterium]
AVTRAGARPGDLLLVTGTLGGPGAALAAWSAGGVPTAWARERFAGPVPRIAEGQALAEAGAHAMLDLSDGLASDARHLAAASGVSVVIHPEQLPVGVGCTPEAALGSGEEYELLVALPPAAVDALRPHWDAQQQTPLTIIGEVQAASVEHPAGTVRVIPRNSPGSVRVEFATGHDHFSPS